MGEKDKLAFIFDFDDTIKWTSYLYALHIAKFACYLYEHLKNNVPYITQLVPMHETIDYQLTKTGGFSRDRFPRSFVETYHHICEKLQLPVDKKIERDVWDIGDAIFNYSADDYKKQGFIDGAKETLEFLVGKGDALYLVTRGEADIQQKKIDGLELERFIPRERMFIVPVDKKAVFAEISKDYDKDKTFVVEDSKDIINAATSSPLSLRGIYIPSPTGTWKFENAENGFENAARVKKLRKIIEIKEKYDEFMVR